MEAKPEWWANAGGFFGHEYRRGDDSDSGYLPDLKENLEQRTFREATGVTNLLVLRNKAEILDVPCGYGRHSLVLAQQGYKVTGIDINTTHLNVANHEARGFKIPPVFKEGDMRNLPREFRGKFDAVINMFYSFGFFSTEEENEHVMREFRKSLKKGGQFLLHTDVSQEIIASGLYKFQETRNLSHGGTLSISEIYDSDSKRIKGIWKIKERGCPETSLTPYSVRIYSAEELISLAHKVGFTDIEIYGSFQGKPFSKTSGELILVAQTSTCL